MPNAIVQSRSRPDCAITSRERREKVRISVLTGCIAGLVLAAGGAARCEEAPEMKGAGADIEATGKAIAGDEAGFVSLFNGKDFSGWHFGTESYALPTEPQKMWKVEDGVIKLGKNLNKPNLISQWDYEDFELRLEWRVMVDKGYNSGVFIRCTRNNDRDNQLNLKQGDEGNFVPGKLPGAKPVSDLLKPAKEWNEWRVVAVGDKVTMWCNGKLGWEGTGFKSKQGYVGLQAEYFPFEFRNLRIKEIGWEALNDLAKWTGKDWHTDGDRLSEDAYHNAVPGKDGGTALVLKDANLKDYRLRLEWHSRGLGGNSNAEGPERRGIGGSAFHGQGA